jgi:hypothetical protein
MTLLIRSKIHKTALVEAARRGIKFYGATAQGDIVELRTTDDPLFVEISMAWMEENRKKRIPAVHLVSYCYNP